MSKDKENTDSEQQLDLVLQGSIDVGLHTLDVRVSEEIKNEGGPDYHTVYIEKPQRTSNGELSYKSVGQGTLIQTSKLQKELED